MTSTSNESSAVHEPSSLAAFIFFIQAGVINLASVIFSARFLFSADQLLTFFRGAK
jgi:hypothetical protein